MTSAWLTGLAMRKKRFSSKLLVAASANSARVMRPTPAMWKLGATATSPKQNSDTPATSSAAAAYSCMSYRRPCSTVPRIMVGTTLLDLNTMRVL